MTRLLAIDPGTTESAFVCFDTDTLKPEWFGKRENAYVRDALYAEDEVETVVIEQVESYGKPVGAEVFTTVMWCGRFAEAWEKASFRHPAAVFVPRRRVKLHLCGATQGVNDAVIRQRLIDMYGPGKDAAIGKKAAPGPLYGMKADVWQALALAVTFAETVLKR